MDCLTASSESAGTSRSRNGGSCYDGGSSPADVERIRAELASASLASSAHGSDRHASSHSPACSGGDTSHSGSRNAPSTADGADGGGASNGRAPGSARGSCRFVLGAPPQPNPKDADEWARFLVAYQAGEWRDWAAFAAAGRYAGDDVDLSARPAAEGKPSREAKKAASRRRRATQEACQYVCTNGIPVDNRAYFLEHGILPPPAMPQGRRKQREAALLRHRFQQIGYRESAERYARHARDVFRVASATVTVACASRNAILFLGQCGFIPVKESSPVQALCSHAMLVENTVVCIPDLQADWRFTNFPVKDAHGTPIRFYASAPVLLSRPGVGAGILDSDGNGCPSRRVEVGRLTLLDTALRPHFGEPDALLLQEIADMCAEALENEHHIANAQRTHRMQRSITRLAAALDPPQSEGILGEVEHQQQHYSSVSLEDKATLCPDRVQVVIDAMRDSLEASAVYGIDVSAFRISSSRGGPMSRQPSASPRNGGGYPSTPWLSASSSLPATTPPIADSGAGPQLVAFEETPEEGQENTQQARPPTKPRAPRSRPTSSAGSRTAPNSAHVPSSPNFRRPSHHFSRSSISSSSIGSLGSSGGTPPAADEQVCSFDDGDERGVAVIAAAGGRAEDLCLSPSEARSSICTFFARRPRSSDMYIFRADLNSDADSDTASSVDDSMLDIFNAGADVPTYLAVPVFDHERQPLYLLLVVYTAPRAMEEADLHFSRACSTLLLSSVLRQRARLVDQAQLSFVRRVQHELRTPLHAILGITDYLRSAAADSEGVKHLLEDSLLPELLQSIRLAGSNLSATLDDVLDLGTASGLRSESDAASNRVEDVYLAAEIEDAVESELEQAEMAARQDRFVDAQQVVDAHLRPESVPTVVISVDPNMRQRWRIDRTRTKKVLCKLLNNALRYNIAKGGLVEVKVRMHPGSESQVDITIADTGVGMSKSFVNNELSKPFVKGGDGFSQGIGLGFTIASSLVAQMSGRLHVHSTPGTGTRVLVTLPLSLPLSSTPIDPAPRRRSYCVQNVHFAGFEGRAMERVREQIMERLDENGVRLTSSPAACDLLVVAEHTLGQTPMGDSDTPVKAAALPVPPPTGPNARILVVASSTIGRHRTLHHLSEHPVQLFKPPYGPTSLETMDAFLSDKAPLQLKLPSMGLRTVSGDRPMPTRQNSHRQAAAAPVAPLVPESKLPTPTVHSIADIKAVAPQTLQDAIAASAPDMPSHDTVAPDAMHPETTVIMPQQDVSALVAEEFRVLIVEDNPLNARLLSTVVRRLGFPYEEARDGQEAVDKFLVFRPACVLLDMSMPVMDGFAACALMRRHQEELGISPRIIAITALSSQADKDRGYEAGCDDWRTKPLAVRNLKADLLVWKEEFDNAPRWEDGAGFDGEPDELDHSAQRIAPAVAV